MKDCKKCGYQRKPTDTTPDFKCPNCDAIYAKVEVNLIKQEKIKQNLVKDEVANERVLEIKRRNSERLLKIKSNKGQRRLKRIVTKTYRGKQEQATAEFQEDTLEMSEKGYSPTSQTWSPGTYGCGAFLFALLLCFIVIGIVVFIYMLIVKPAGMLTVTYELRDKPIQLSATDDKNTKTCPKCAESIKEAAIICRYCQHNFDL